MMSLNSTGGKGSGIHGKYMSIADIKQPQYVKEPNKTEAGIKPEP
jgi:hypothetical protein